MAASSRSTPARFATEASHARTSPVSNVRAARSWWRSERQFADLLDEPPEGAVDAPDLVSLEVRLAEGLLERGELHGRPSLAAGRDGRSPGRGFVRPGVG